MKKYILLFICTILTISFYSCKKDSTGLSNSNAAGTWEGRYTTNGSAYSTFVRFTIQSSGNLTVSDTSGGTVYPGAYNISGDSLITITGGTVLNFRMKALNDVSRFEGKWQNLSSPSYYGTFFLDKK